jgi:hypothetical protein
VAQLFLHFPDTEAIASTALHAAGIRAYSSIPANPIYPLVTVKRMGGIPQDKRALDRSNLQIDVWGNSKSECRDLALAARLVLMSLEGTTSSDFNGTVTAVEDSQGLFWLPDQETKRDRYIFSVTMFAKQYLPITT